MSPTSLTIRLAQYGNNHDSDDSPDRPTIRTIRQTVFWQEQNVPEDLDFDGQDPQATHFLAEVDGQPVATMRLRRIDDTTAKLERVAVLPSHRRQGIAVQMIEAAIAHLQHQGITTVKVHAQTYIQPLYDRLQFIPQGEPFWEAGIEHVKMVRCI